MATAKERARLARLAAKDAAPFVGCDGEGVKTPDGRSHYALFRMGARELYHPDARRLTTPELLSFIVAHPDPGDALTAFAFDYDASNILADIPTKRDHPDRPSRLERLLGLFDQPDVTGAAFAWTWLNFDGFPQFGVKYLPRNYLKVCLGETIRFRHEGRRIVKTLPIPGTERAIFDSFGNFQSSFLKALQAYDIGREHWQRIDAMKRDRDKFNAIDDEVRVYNSIECDLLADLMTAFRSMSLAAGIRPKTWNGAGKLAAAMLNDWGVVKAKDLPALVPAPVLAMANAAYYGGRFEITRAGQLGPTWEHDICSAYPAEMVNLPCLVHGTWRKCSGSELVAQPDDAIFVCPIRFFHRKEQFLCGFPFRMKDGRLCWPRVGNGVYWSHEIKSAERLGATCEYRAGWLYEAHCDCRPFAKVTGKYAERLAAGKAARGLPIKFGLNALTGKLAERKGKAPPFRNPIWAGLVTAGTRAKLNDAIAKSGDPRRVVMLATDGIYTVDKPIKLKKGEALGQWEVKRYPKLFIVRPGLYWPPRPRTPKLSASGLQKPARKWKLKSRGLSPKFFEPRVAAFQRAWRAYMTRDYAQGAAPPMVEVEVETFIGLRLAYRLKRPGLACQWVKRTFNSTDWPPIRCTFDWHAKREGDAPTADGRALILGSKEGSAAAHSLAYDGSALMPWVEPIETDHMIFEAMPDPVELSAPFTD